MKYFLDVSSGCVDKPSGIYRYIRQLSRAMIKEVGFAPFSYVVRTSKFKKRATLPYWMWPKTQPYEGFFHSFKQPALLHGMDMRLPYAPKIATLVSAMDVAPFRLNEHPLSSQRFLKKKRADYHKAFKRADLILSISQATGDDICDLFDVDPKKIRVTHLGVQTAFRPTCNPEILSRYGLKDLDGKYLLYVGTLSVRKNLPRLLQAYNQSKVKNDFPLILSGERSFGAQAIFDEIHRLGLSDKVRWIGYAANQDLPALYSHAAGFTFPTMYEGFGLPILEAMSCGTPVLSGNIGAAPEIAGGYALMTDPFSVDAITAQLDQLPNMTAHNQAEALSYAQGFSWQKTAQKTLSAYQEALDLRT